MIPYVNLHSHHFTQFEQEIGLYNLRFIELDQLQQRTGFYSLGIHPWFYHSETEQGELQLIKDLSNHPSLLAIGECGLDRTIATPMSEQERVFETQLRMAQEANKPVIIHCVRAFSELISFKKRLKISVPMIVHGYNNNLTIAEQLLQNGFYLSLGAALLNPASNACKVIGLIPPERLFLETDDRAIPISTIFVAASKLLNVSVDALKKQCHRNFEAIFLIDSSSFIQTF